VDGSKVCLFAYGQTGSGKTHTMLGDEQSKGLIFRAVDKVFEAKRAMEEGKESVWKVGLSVEMLEIYNERVNDLMNREGVDLVVNDNEVVGSTKVVVRKVADVKKVGFGGGGGATNVRPDERPSLARAERAGAIQRSSFS
jgi:kinesin family protein C1